MLKAEVFLFLYLQVYLLCNVPVFFQVSMQAFVLVELYLLLVFLCFVFNMYGLHQVYQTRHAKLPFSVKSRICMPKWCGALTTLIINMVNFTMLMSLKASP